MPQFEDISSFSSQIFWLLVCFGVLYFAVSTIYLPRIKEILDRRNKNIQKNNSSANEIKDQIEKVDISTKNLRETSAKQYKISIDQSLNQGKLAREEGLRKLKEKINKTIEESKKEIASFQKTTEDQSQETIEELASKIERKFFTIN
ncbi:MAG: F-type H+-transporting ATPase subunit b [Lentimonas sp.]|jgi:F-type H+-transporting ATPase subunit b